MIIGESFIPEHESKLIMNTLESEQFPWHYNSYTNCPTHKRERSQFVHIFYNHAFQERSQQLDLILKVFQNKIPEFNTHRLLRVKGNLNVRYADKRILPPHTDLDHEGVSYLYYVNDSDGDTIFYNGWNRKSSKPQRGKLLRFSALDKHTGNIPRKHDRRIVINFLFDHG